MRHVPAATPSPAANRASSRRRPGSFPGCLETSAAITRRTTVGEGRAPAFPAVAWAPRPGRYLARPRAWPRHRGHRGSSPWSGPSPPRSLRGAGPSNACPGPRRSRVDARVRRGDGNLAKVTCQHGSAPPLRASASRRPGLGSVIIRPWYCSKKKETKKKKKKQKRKKKDKQTKTKKQKNKLKSSNKEKHQTTTTKKQSITN